jgi:hypothetical protein
MGAAASQLFDAVDKGDIQKVRLLVQRYPQCIGAVDEQVRARQIEGERAAPAPSPHAPAQGRASPPLAPPRPPRPRRTAPPRCTSRPAAATT